MNCLAYVALSSHLCYVILGFATESRRISMLFGGTAQIKTQSAINYLFTDFTEAGLGYFH